MPGRIPLPAGLYTIGEAAEKIGVPAHTLRAWDNDGVFKTSTVDYGGLAHRVYSESDIELLTLLKRNIDARKHNEKKLRQFFREHGDGTTWTAETAKQYTAWARKNLVHEPALPNDPRLGDYDPQEQEESTALSALLLVLQRRHGWTRCKSCSVDKNAHAKKITIEIAFE